jgi:3-phosphoshikimate 1-carboxyvinyltransferase
MIPFEFNSSIHENNIKINDLLTSQTLSGLLFSLPFISKNSKIYIEKPISRSYIDLSLKMLNKMGIDIVYENNVFFIKGNQVIENDQYFASSDSSSAAFWYAIKNYKSNINYHYFCNEKIYLDHEFLQNIYKNKEFQNSKFSLKDHPDLFPILIVLATNSTKNIVIQNISRLENKESNRVESSLKILRSLNCSFQFYKNNDAIVIQNINSLPNSINLDSGNDHRIVMAAILIRIIFNIKVKIINKSAVKKSYPNIFDDLELIGVNKNEFNR